MAVDTKVKKHKTLQTALVRRHAFFKGRGCSDRNLEMKITEELLFVTGYQQKLQIVEKCWKCLRNCST